MLPVSAWPPGPPGASLSPFGKPRQIAVFKHPHGFVIPKGAWIVTTTANSVVMFSPKGDPWVGVNQTPGTGFLPGQIPPPPHPPSPPCKAGRRPSTASPATTAGGARPTSSPTTATVAAPSSKSCQPPRRFQKHNTVLEAWRAWQRQIGRTPPPVRPTPGRRPPNWFGWKLVCAPGATLVHPYSAGLVVADGQNVVIGGGGCATITQAYSV